MRYNSNLHPLSHLAKSLAGRFASLRYAPGEIVVVNYHSTPARFINQFQKQIEFYSRNFDIISPDEFRKRYRSKVVNEKPALLFTFDDGLQNNRHALDVLENHGYRAWLFIVPDFILSSDQPVYYQQNIRPVINRYIDSHTEDLSALSFSELKTIHEKGHAIGIHSATHTQVREDDDSKDIYEILTSKKVCAENLDLQSEKLDAYCSINNSLLSTGYKQMQLIKSDYNFCFSTLPGTNTSFNPWFIRRANVESHWLMGAVKLAITGTDWKRWENKVKAFSQQTGLK